MKKIRKDAGVLSSTSSAIASANQMAAATPPPIAGNGSDEDDKEEETTRKTGEEDIPDLLSPNQEKCDIWESKDNRKVKRGM